MLSNPLSLKTTAQKKKLFGGEARSYELTDTPSIIIETFKNAEGDIVKGIASRIEKQQKPGGDYMDGIDPKKRLSSVIICPTTPRYVYIFQSAELKPHCVLSRPETTNYLMKILPHDNIQLKRYSVADLREPIKIISDNSISNGLRAGNREESEFYFFSDQTEIFNTLFNNDRLEFDLDKLMTKYDKQAALSTNTTDELSRGFVDGHTDLGFTREGALTNTRQSQSKSGEHVCARPTIMGSEEDLKLLGNIPDVITELIDRYCYENDEKLMPDEERDREFASKLRSRIGLKISRFEAYTIVRQFISTLENFDASTMNGTARHTDGPNCSQPGYRHTAVFSFLCVWKKVSQVDEGVLLAIPDPRRFN